MRYQAIAACASLAMIFGSVGLHAQVVALGASNTAGKGVPQQSAYPAQLEAMLRAQGQSVQVINAGISGDTTDGMLARLNAAVPNGTRVVILQPGGNDWRKGRTGADRQANVDQIIANLRSRGVQVVMLDNQMLQAVPDQYRQPDGQHLTPQGYQLLASRIMPQVVAALGQQQSVGTSAPPAVGTPPQPSYPTQPSYSYPWQGRR